MIANVDAITTVNAIKVFFSEFFITSCVIRGGGVEFPVFASAVISNISKMLKIVPRKESGSTREGYLSSCICLVGVILAETRSSY